MDQLTEFLGNHPVLFTALVVIAILLILNELSPGLTGEKRLSPLEAVRMINDRDALVLDVRTVADYKRGHILNAINVPHTRLDERLTELDKHKERPIVVYCALGGVAAQASHKLKKAGYREVYPIRGGINNWMGASLPVTTR